MAVIKKKWRVVGIFILNVGLMGLLISCGSSLQEQKNGTTMTPTPATPPPQSAAVAKNLERVDSRYYDFEDIRIPNELKLDEKKSNIYKSQDIKAGVLQFDGYVEIKSLINFFMIGMAKDNWKLKADFKRPPQTILLFEKKDKRSIFFIEDTAFNTHVEIWMIPTRD
jgi:hypothetical protein